MALDSAPIASGQAFGVNQTSFLFAALAFAFLFFITVRGDLAKWLGVFGLSGGAGSAPGTVPLAALNPLTGLLPSSGTPTTAGPYGYISPGSVLQNQGGAAP